jgi:predicted secreted protein
MLKQVLLLAFCLIAVVLGAGGLIRQQPSRAVWLTESEASAGSTVALAVGDTLGLVLDVNPSTGHAWEIGIDYAAVMRSLDAPEYAEADAAGRVGGEGYYAFCLLAVGGGQVELKLIIAARLSRASRN